MHSASPTLVEYLDQYTDRQSVIITPVQPVQPVQSVQIVQPARQTPIMPSTIEPNAYHFIQLDDQDACPPWLVVNGRGVPDDTLTAFAHHLASSTGAEQAQTALAPLLSYLSAQAQHGILWYAPAGCLREVWQNYLRQYANREMTRGEITVLEVTAAQSHALHALQSMLAQFYTFAIARAIYGYQHPFADKRCLICLSIPSHFRGLFSLCSKK